MRIAARSGVRRGASRRGVQENITTQGARYLKVIQHFIKNDDSHYHAMWRPRPIPIPETVASAPPGGWLVALWLRRR